MAGRLQPPYVAGWARFPDVILTIIRTQSEEIPALKLGSGHRVFSDSSQSVTLKLIPPKN
jgi:hypothetical protein